MSLGQKIVDKIDELDTDLGRVAKKKIIAAVIDDAFAEVAAKYAGVLRDKFAGDALIATLSHVQNITCLGSHNEKAITNMAEDAYKMADAMLKARVL